MTRLLFLFFCISLSSFSQIIRVVDAHTQEKIEGATLIDTRNNKRWITNKYGQVVLKKEDTGAVFFVRHKNYQNQKIAYNKSNKKVVLKPHYQDLKSVVLSVSKARETKQKISEHIEILSKKDIDYVSPQTSADLLANTPGIRVQKSQFGGGSPVLRGMESNRVLLVVDGVRMNNAIYRKGHLQNAITVSPFALERTEIVFGPASVSYGSDALGGVIHFYTKELNYSDTIENKNKVFYRHSTVNNENSVAFSSYTSHKKWASFSNVSLSDFGDLRMGKNRVHGYQNWGKVFEYSKNEKGLFSENASINSNPNIQKNTGYKQFDILQKIKFPIHQNIDFVFNGQFSKSGNISNFGKLNDQSEGALRFAEWHYGPQQRLLVSTKLNFSDYKSIFENGAITLAYQNIKESRINRRFGSLQRNSRFEDVAVFSLNSDFYKALTPKGNRKLFYGLELVHNKVNSSAKGEELQITNNNITGIHNVFAIDTRYPNNGSTYSSAALYTSYRQELNKKQTLNLGIRATSTLLKSSWNTNVGVTIPDNTIELLNTALTGSVGYVYKPKEHSKINVVLSKGFRAPNVDDIGKIRSKSGKLTVPNTKLKPEQLYSLEMGFAKENKYKTARINANAYFTLLDDYIARAPSREFGTSINFDEDTFSDENILANTNQGQAYIYGTTLSGYVELAKDIKSNLSATYTKGKSYDTNDPLSSIPPLFGNVSIGMYKPKFDVALDYRFSLAKKLRDYNLVEGIDNIEETPNGNGTPAWQILNLNTNYHFNKKMRVQFQIQNIFDVHYKEFASSISAPGRNVVAALAYSF